MLNFYHSFFKMQFISNISIFFNKDNLCQSYDFCVLGGDLVPPDRSSVNTPLCKPMCNLFIYLQSVRMNKTRIKFRQKQKTKQKKKITFITMLN